MYRFKKQYADAFIIIPGTRQEINAKNLDDAGAKLILEKYPQFAHNIEFVEPVYEESEEVKSEESEEVKEKRKRRTKAEIEADEAAKENVDA